MLTRCLSRRLSVAARILSLCLGSSLLVLATCGSPKDVLTPPGDAVNAAPSDAGGADAASRETGGSSLPWVAVGGGVRVDFEAAGLRADGAVCAFDQQCASGLCSASPAGTSCGICLGRRRLGERCDLPATGCSPSAVCRDGVCRSTKKIAGEVCGLYPKGSDRGDCDDELSCVGKLGADSGLCTVRPPVGASCDAWTSCERGALCVQGVCTSQGPGSCALRGCADGFVCQTEGSVSMCREGLLGEGAPCGVRNGQIVAGECKPGTVCGNLAFPNGGGGPDTLTTCLALPREGELCINSHCAEGLFCAEQSDGLEGIANRRCMRLRVVGESCEAAVYGPDRSSYYATCAAGLECRQGTCQPPCS